MSFDDVMYDNFVSIDIVVVGVLRSRVIVFGLVIGMIVEVE